MVTLNPQIDDGLLIDRANAIQAYAQIETTLTILMAHFLGVAPGIAGMIFYRVVNTRSREVILSDLRKAKYGDTHKIYWESLMGVLRGLNGKRNEIVHWHTAVNIDLKDEGVTYETTLVPPNVWAHNANTQPVNRKDLADFIAKSSFVSQSLVMLHGYMTTGKAGLPNGDTWHEIFQRETAYPPPHTHPLNPSFGAHESPPQASAE